MRRPALVLLLGMSLSLSGGPADVFRWSSDLESFIDQVGRRIQEAPALTDWSARIRSDSRRMDGKWKPKTITVVEKTVTVRKGVMTEEIHRATEEKKGRVRDITKKMAAEAAIARAKARRKSEKEGSKEGGRDHSRQFTLSMRDAIPFLPENRDQYEFRFAPDEEWNKKPVRVVEVRAVSPSDRRMEGAFRIDPESFDILQAELRPSKKRSVLKRFEMTVLFTRLPTGQLVLGETRVKIHVGLVIKNIRVEAHEVYSDYRILTDIR